MLKAKLKAMLVHAGLTVITALTMFFFVYWLWYPQIFSQIMPGTKLFLLILLVEVILGPCMSLIIFNPQKKVRELILDYAIVSAFQLSALVYGLISVIGSRPAYVVFVKDRFDVVAAKEISDEDMQEASTKNFTHLSLTGPKFICVRAPKDTEDRKRLLFLEIPQGKDVQHLPRFYRLCADGEVFEHAYPLDKLSEIVTKKGLQKVLDNFSLEDNVRWLPISGRLGTWVALLRPFQNIPFEYIPIDPYE